MDNEDVGNGVAKYHSTERKNLVQLLKLCIKSFIDFALSLNSSLEEEDATLYQLFVVLEKILCHGLKDKSGLFNNRSDFFNVLQVALKEVAWTKDIFESSINMPNLKTFTGKGRAFLRLVMIQKKSHVLFSDIMERLEKVRSLYEPHAMLLSEEAHIISGLLVGINVIDCNLCLKESDLDNLPQVIQLCRYLRDGNYLEAVTPPGSPHPGKNTTTAAGDSYQQVLEQKSYVEEINERLKLDYELTEKKSRMFQEENELLSKEIISIKSALAEVSAERDCLRQRCDDSEQSFQRRIEIEKADIAAERETYEASRSGLNELYLMAKAELAGAQERLSHLESDLDMERKIKGDVDKANGLLEKELRDKEDTIEALRKQCGDVKKLNLTMLGKVQESDRKLAEKTESLKNSEARSEMSSSELSELQHRTKELDVENSDLKKELDQLKKKLFDAETGLEQATTGCGVEREWRENLQKQCTAHREEIAKLRAETTQVAEMKSALRQLKRENDDLKRSCSEQERALVELGDHLSRSKVKAEELKYTVEVAKDNKWVADNEAVNCQQCKKNFSVARRRHHCRNCGGIFCHQCSDNTMPLPSSSRPLRVCDGCSESLLTRSLKE